MVISITMLVQSFFFLFSIYFFSFRSFTNSPEVHWDLQKLESSWTDFLSSQNPLHYLHLLCTRLHLMVIVLSSFLLGLKLEVYTTLKNAPILHLWGHLHIFLSMTFQKRVIHSSNIKKSIGPNFTVVSVVSKNTFFFEVNFLLTGINGLISHSPQERGSSR